MNFLLKIQSGPQIGKCFNIRNGQKIGRNRAHINLNDPKASGLHAQFVKDPSGKVYLVDLGSKNGLVVKGKKLKKVEISEDISIRIGNTSIGFEALPEKTKEVPSKKHEYDIPEVKPPEPSPSSIPAPQAKPPPSVPPKSTKKAIPKPIVEEKKEESIIEEDFLDFAEAEQNWKETLIDFLESTERKTKDSFKKITPFEKIVELNILTGPQRKTLWTVGYGPRKFGHNCFEFPILELGAPELCFSIDSKKGKPYFRTDHPTVVTLNNDNLKAEELKDGDCIKINTTSIEVRLRDAD